MSENAKRIAMKFINFLRPAPLDGWVIITLLYWLVAAVGSILWYQESTYIDPVKLPMPLLACALAMIAGLSLVAFHRGVSRRILALFSATIFIGGLIFLFAAPSLDVTPPVGLDSHMAKRTAAFSAFVQAYSWHPVFVLVVALGAFLFTSSFRWVQKANSLLITWVPRSLSYLNKHRARAMITFVVIMLPATVLRNAIDPEFRSSPYIVTPFITGLSLFGGIIAAYLVGKFVLNRQWMPLKIAAAVLISVATSGHLLSEAFSRQGYSVLQYMGADYAWAFAPVFFTFSFLAASFSGTKANPLPWRKQFSIWSLLLTLPVLWLCSSLLYRYDPLVVVRALVTDPTKFTQAKWLSTAEDSRTVQRFTGGAVRVLDQFGSPLYYVKIRDERDANVLDLLLQQRQTASTLVIENMQPCVNTVALDGFQGHLGVLSGELTPKHMLDICKTISSFVVCDVQLPSRNDGATLPQRFGTDSRNAIPGFADFIDAYITTRKSPISIRSKLTMEDWNALLRANQRCPFGIGQYPLLPVEASTATEIKNQASLSGITIEHVDLSYNPDAIKILETDIQIRTLWIPEEQMMWDLAFSNPKITRMQSTAESERLSFQDAARFYHWAYGWNEDDEITHLWLPSIDEVVEHSDLLSAVRTLRFDRRGFIGFRTLQNLNFNPPSKLPKLERLYLGSGEYFGDLRFLAKLPKLEHLQIQAQNRTGMPFNGYEVCKNLKTARFFGTPQAKTIKELGGLKNLRRVEIVDDDSSFTTESAINKLQTELPGIEIQIIAPADFQPDLSEKLQQHLDEVREKLGRERK